MEAETSAVTLVVVRPAVTVLVLVFEAVVAVAEEGLQEDIVVQVQLQVQIWSDWPLLSMSRW